MISRLLRDQLLYQMNQMGTTNVTCVIITYVSIIWFYMSKQVLRTSILSICDLKISDTVKQKAADHSEHPIWELCPQMRRDDNSHRAKASQMQALFGMSIESCKVILHGRVHLIHDSFHTMDAMLDTLYRFGYLCSTSKDAFDCNYKQQKVWYCQCPNPNGTPRNNLSLGYRWCYQVNRSQSQANSSHK